MNKKIISAVIALVVALGVLAVFASTPVAAQDEKKPLVIAIALGLLGEDPNLKAMMGNITEVNWKLITGDFTYNDIKDADMIIFVQVDTSYNLSKDELNAIKRWFDQGGKTIWVSGDSDYSGGDFKRIPVTNAILEAVGSHLRNDNVEVEDPTWNCGAGYRVAAAIQPDPALEFLQGGVYHKVLFHGPGALAIYYDGKWYPFFNDSKLPLPNIYKIAVTSPDATIHEFVKPFPAAYNVLNPPHKSFVVMAAEIDFSKQNIVILSGDAPYDHYTPMWVDSYHALPLSGSTFVTNVILWGVGLLGQRMPVVAQMEQQMSSYQEKISSLQSELNSVKSQLSNAQNEMNSLKSQLSNAQNQISSLKSQLTQAQQQSNQYKAQVAQLQKQVQNLKSQVSNLSTMQWVYAIIGIIIGLIIGWLIARAGKK